MRNARSLVVGFAAGIAVAGATMALAQVRASVDTNGILVGYTVQKGGQTVCEDPTVTPHHEAGIGPTGTGGMADHP